MSDAREAREKLRNLDYRGLGNWYTPDGELLDQEDVNQLRATVAMHSLEEHPADEGEPLSREWLVSIGGRLSPFLEGNPSDDSEEWYCDFDCDVEGGMALSVWNDGTVYLGTERLLRKITTRGDVRNLISALGIGK